MSDQNKGCIDFTNAKGKITVNAFNGRPVIGFGIGITKMHTPPMLTVFQPQLGETGDHGTVYSTSLETASYTVTTKLYEFPEVLGEEGKEVIQKEQVVYHEVHDEAYDKYIDWLMAPENRNYYNKQKFFKQLYNTAKANFHRMYKIEMNDIDVSSENFLKEWRTCLTNQSNGVIKPVRKVTFGNEGEERSAIQMKFKQRIISTYSGTDQKNKLTVMDEADNVIDGAELGKGDMIRLTHKFSPWVMSTGAGISLKPVIVRRVMRREFSSGEGMKPISCYNLPNLKRENDDGEEGPKTKKIKTETPPPPALRV